MDQEKIIVTGIVSINLTDIGNCFEKGNGGSLFPNDLTAWILAKEYDMHLDHGNAWLSVGGE